MIDNIVRKAINRREAELQADNDERINTLLKLVKGIESKTSDGFHKVADTITMLADYVGVEIDILPAEEERVTLTPIKKSKVK